MTQQSPKLEIVCDACQATYWIPRVPPAASPYKLTCRNCGEPIIFLADGTKVPPPGTPPAST